MVKPDKNSGHVETWGRFEHKAMPCVCENFKGNNNCELVPDGQGISVKDNSQNLKRVYEVFMCKILSFVNIMQVFL